MGYNFVAEIIGLSSFV